MGTEPEDTSDFYSAFKLVRNRLKYYWSKEIVEQALESLRKSWGKSVSEYNDLGILPPWTSLLVIKWGLVYGSGKVDARKHLSSREWTQLANSISNLPAQLGQLDDPNPAAIWRFMRAYAVHQFYFQRTSHFHGIALFETLRPYLTTRYSLEERVLEFTGLSLRTFIELQLLVPGYIMAQPAPRPFKAELFGGFHYHFPLSDIEKFLRFSSLDLSELHSFLLKDHKWIKNPEFEIGLLSSLHKKPFLRTGDQYIAYHPALLGEYIEHGIYDILKERDSSDFSGAFGYAFEEYVNRCISVSISGYLREPQLKKLFRAGACPDFGMSFGSDTLLIEAKSSEMHPHTHQNPQESHLKKTLENSVIKGYRQIIRAAQSIRKNKFIEFPAEGDIFGLIISLKPLYLGSPISIWQEFMEASIKDHFGEAILRDLPIRPEHIFCLSAYEFDCLCAYSREKSINLIACIKTIVEDHSTRGPGGFFLEHHFKDFQITMNSFPHIKETLKGIMDRIAPETGPS